MTVMQPAYYEELDKIAALQKVALGPKTWQRGMAAARRRIAQGGSEGTALAERRLRRIQEMLPANAVASAKRKKVPGRTEAQAVFDRAQNRNVFNSRRADLASLRQQNSLAMDAASRSNKARIMAGAPSESDTIELVMRRQNARRHARMAARGRVGALSVGKKKTASPRSTGALIGALLGGATGVSVDKENPVRGGLIGGAAGGVLGAGIGHGVDEIRGIGRRHRANQEASDAYIKKLRQQRARNQAWHDAEMKRLNELNDRIKNGNISVKDALDQLFPG